MGGYFLVCGGLRPAERFGLRRLEWQGRQDSNLQPLVLETSALPIELHPSAALLDFVSTSSPGAACAAGNEGRTCSARAGPGRFSCSSACCTCAPCRSCTPARSRVDSRPSPHCLQTSRPPFGGHAELGPGHRGKRRNSMARRARCQRGLGGAVELGRDRLRRCVVSFLGIGAPITAHKDDSGEWQADVAEDLDAHEEAEEDKDQPQ
jgi:hypothetical protein